MEIILTIKLNAAIRLAERIFRYAFIAAVIGLRDRAYHKFHVHLVRIVRKRRLVLVTCNLKIRVSLCGLTPRARTHVHTHILLLSFFL